MQYHRWRAHVLSEVFSESDEGSQKVARARTHLRETAVWQARLCLRKARQRLQAKQEGHERRGEALLQRRRHGCVAEQRLQPDAHVVAPQGTVALHFRHVHRSFERTR